MTSCKDVMHESLEIWCHINFEPTAVTSFCIRKELKHNIKRHIFENMTSSVTSFY